MTTNAMFAGLLPKKAQRPRARAQAAAVKPSRADSNAALRKIVGERFVEARKINGWDQTEAAEKFGYKNSTQLSLIEQGKRLPPHEVMIKASEIYGVSVDFLFGLSDEPERDPKAAERNAAMRHVHALVSGTAENMVGLLLQYLAHGVPSVRTAQTLLNHADDLALAVNRVRAMNTKLFDEKLKGGSNLVKLADQTANACAQAREMLSRHERVTEFKIRAEEKRVGVTHPLFDLPAVVRPQ
jgi:transcriptional regulator with XRE-family HTH domain